MRLFTESPLLEEKKSIETKNNIPKLAEKHYNLSSAKIDNLLYTSKMAAKIDNAAVQDGYSLYHHVILFDKQANWTVVQQGMNPNNKMARSIIGFQIF